MKTSLRGVGSIAEPVAKSVGFKPEKIEKKKKKTHGRCTFHQGPTRNSYVVFNTDVRILHGTWKTSTRCHSLFYEISGEEKR